MFKRISCLFFALLLTMPASPLNGPARVNSALPPPGIRVYQDDERGVIFRLETESYSLEEISIEGELYQDLAVTGAGPGGATGSPELPVVSVLIGVPPGALVELRATARDVIQVGEKVRLPPVPHSLPPHDEYGAARLAYARDDVAYSADLWLPLEAARIAEDAWLRDQRLVRVEVFPFQYNAAQEALVWLRSLQVELVFHDGEVVERQAFDRTGNPFEAWLRASLLNYDSARDWRSNPGPTSAVSQTAAPLAAGTRYKILADEEGLYRLTYADLQAAGLPVDSLDPRNLRLSNMGQETALLVIGEADGRFDGNDSIVFYGEKFSGQRFAAIYGDPSDLYWLLDNCAAASTCPAGAADFRRDEGLHYEKYTQENVYWLELSDEPGLRMDTTPGAPGDAPLAEAYLETSRAEQSNLRWPNHFTGEETWFWNRIRPVWSPTNTAVTTTYTTTLSAIASGAYTATIRAEVVARSHDPTTSPDHHTLFSINDYPLDDNLWDGAIRYAFEEEAPQSELIDGENRLHFTVHKAGAITAEDIYFDHFEIDYYRGFKPQNNRLFFTGAAPGPQRFEVEGFTTSDLFAFDLTDAYAPVRILGERTGATASYTFSFEMDQHEDARYFVGSLSSFLSPKEISAYDPPDLRSGSNAADYIFITHRDFITPTQALAGYRSSRGMRTAVVDIDDLYNLFTGGIYNPVAIKRFLAYAYENWEPPAPAYALLVGDGHWNFMGDGAASYGEARPVRMPPYLVWSDPWQGEVDSSNLLAAFVGDDLLPDIMLGRAPVSSADQMQAIVDKTIAFESAAQAGWQQRALFAADNAEPEVDFKALSEAVSQRLPTAIEVDPHYLDDYMGDGAECSVNNPCPAITAEITASLNITGASFLNYTGQGFVPAWAQEQILARSHIPTLDNGQRLPIVVDMTGLTGYWYHPVSPAYSSLAVELLAAESRGAVATFSPSGMGLGQEVLHAAFYDALFEDDVAALGEAAGFSKLALYETGKHHELINSFTVFGDPALRFPTGLHRPYLSVDMPGISGLPGEELVYHLSAGNTGTVTDAFTIEIEGGSWDPEISISEAGPLDPGEAIGFTVSVTIPEAASAAEVDILQIKLISQGNPEKSDRATLRASVGRPLFLPVITR